ncbi:SBBP repeat-containing protein [Persicitalea sp.]|uniref:SBBP repeat-containing protein n=1 Tax=Persicitalea sp. TaxID=3100273 RepID=UPI0035945796
MKRYLHRWLYSLIFGTFLLVSVGWLPGCAWEDPTLKTLKNCTLPTAVTTVGVNKTNYTYALVTVAPADIKAVIWKVQQGNTVLKQADRSDTTAFSHNYAVSGTYTVSAEIETVCGEKVIRTITTSTTVKTCVLPSAITVASASNDTYRYKLVTSAPADVKAVAWKVANGGTTLSQQSRTDTAAFSYAYTSAGIYTVTAEIESVCGEKITQTTSTTFDPGISASARFATWKLGSSGNDVGRSVAVDAASNVYVVGTYSASFSFGAVGMGIAGTNDVFIAKYNSKGDGLWIQRITGNETDEVKDIAIDAQGDVYVTGEVSSNAGYYASPDDVRLGVISRKTVNGKSDAFLAKYSRDGNLLWFKNYGGSNPDAATSIALHSSGIYMTGIFGAANTTLGTVTLGGLGVEGKFEMFLAKLNYSGDVLWAVSSGGFESDFASNVAVDTDGNVYMLGSYESPGTFRSASGASKEYSSNVSPDIFIAKYDSFGNLQNFHRGNSGTFVYGNSLAINNGALYATGIVGGGKYGSTSVDYKGGNGDMFLAKYNLSTLNMEWLRTAGSPGFDAGNKVVFDKTGNIYVAGLLSDKCQFGNTTISAVGDTDAFLAQYDPSGNFRFAKSVGSTAPDGFNSLALNSSGSLIFMVGYFGGNVKTETFSLTSSGSSDVLITKYPD